MSISVFVCVCGFCCVSVCVGGLILVWLYKCVNEKVGERLRKKEGEREKFQNYGFCFFVLPVEGKSSDSITRNSLRTPSYKNESNLSY